MNAFHCLYFECGVRRGISTRLLLRFKLYESNGEIMCYRPLSQWRLINIFFLISFESIIVLYFAHVNEVRKANYYS